MHVCAHVKHIAFDAIADAFKTKYAFLCKICKFLISLKSTIVIKFPKVYTV